MVKKKFIGVIKIISLSLALAFCLILFAEISVAASNTEIYGLLLYPSGTSPGNPAIWTFGKPQRMTWGNWSGYFDSSDQAQIHGTSSPGGVAYFISRDTIDNDYYYLWSDWTTLPAVPESYKSSLIMVDLHDLGGISEGDRWYHDREYVFLDATLPSNPTKAYAYSDSSRTAVLTDGKWYTYSTPYFTWEASSSTDVNVYHAYLLRSTAPAINKEDASPSISRSSRNYSPPSPLTQPGLYKFWITTEDKATSEAVHPGNVSWPLWMFTYGFDDTPPAASMILPQYINSTTFPVSWEGNDYDASGVGSYELQYKSSDMTDFAPWLITSGTSSVFTGGETGKTYSFKVRAIDKALPSGNIGNWSNQKSILVDTGKPYSNVTGPTGTVTDLSPTITWTGGDTVSGIQNYIVQYKDLTAGEPDWTGLYTGQMTSVTFTPGVNGRTYCLRSQAIDKAGNIEDWPVNLNGDVVFTIQAGDAPTNLRIITRYDNNIPSFTWNPPSSTQGYSVAIDSMPDDAIDNPPGTQLNYTSGQLPDGRHTFRVKSYNNENIWSGFVAVDFIIDIRAPVIGGVIIDQNGGIVSISGVASDEVEIKTVKYQILNSGKVIKDWTNAYGSFGSSSCAFSISETMNDDGTFKFKMKAIDEVDREGFLETSPFMIDLKDPAVTINSPSMQGAPGPITADPMPIIDATLSDGNGIDCASLEINGLDGNIDYHFKKDFAASGASPYFLKHRLTQELKEGQYDIIITAKSSAKTSSASMTIKVFAGSVRTLTKPYSYPNPFKPGIDNITVRYELSRDSSVKFMIYNMAGKPVKTYAFTKGRNGGHAGTNDLIWDSRDNFGKTVANGPYYYYLIVDGKVIGKGEMAAFK